MVEVASDFPSCARTYATLCLYGKELHPPDVDRVLGVRATRAHHAGQNLASGGAIRLARTAAWFLSSEGQISSQDLQKHLEYLLDAVSDRYQELAVITEIESSLIMCYWESKAGNGGPVLGPDVMRRLASLGLELNFDIWFNE